MVGEAGAYYWIDVSRDELSRATTSWMSPARRAASGA
jgi:hypothetical protein